jgi:transglutaminase-like putative cysteine protease
MFKRSKFLAISTIVTASVVLLLALVVVFSLGGAFGSPPTLVFRSNSAQMLYDGSPLSDDGYELLSGQLKAGHTAKVEVTGLQNGVGKSENRIYVTILDALGADVTSDYNVVLEYGILEITPRVISISTGTEYKEYDGEPLEYSSWEINTPDALMPGDSVKVYMTGKQTEIGSAFNTCDVYVYDSNGTDVTYNYEIDVEKGVLTVTPVELHVQSYPYTTQFGEIAECSEYGVDDWDLLPGHMVAEVKITGRQEMPGTSPNTIEYVRVVDGYGNDVTHYYDIIKSEGALTVEPYDYDREGALANLATQNGGRVYIKDQSFGQYMGDGWAYARTYPNTYENYSADYLTGCALRDAGVRANTLAISWFGGDGFGLPYYMAMDEFNSDYDQRRDTLYGSAVKEYFVGYYPIERFNQVYVHNNAALSIFEREYRKHVYEHYLQIDQETLVYMRDFANRAGLSGRDLATIYRAADIIQGSANYDIHYDTELDSEVNMAIAFLENYKSGVCRHFATAATLLYRALGIPARYTEGFALDTHGMRETSIVKDMRHAWVEVYIDGMGWIAVEVTGYIGGASNRVDIIFNSDSYKRGEERPEITYTGFEKYAEEGYVLIPQYYPIPENYGKHPIGMSDYTIYDEDGNDVTSNFSLTQQMGTMQIYRELIYVDSYASDKNDTWLFVYDGEAHSISDIHYDKTLLSKDGRTLMYYPIAHLQEVGETAATFGVDILDENGQIVTHEYRIIKSYGKIKITPRPIEITIKSETKSYDGKELVANKYAITGGSLVGTHTIERIDIAGFQTEPGVSEAWISGAIIIDNRTFQSVTHNYTIICIPGELRVTD